jgi:hypothetical protein
MKIEINDLNNVANYHFDFKKLESTWNTFDEKNEGRRIPWGQPSHELCVYADAAAKWIFENNPWGYPYDYFGELAWHDNLWDIMDQEELVQRIIDVLQGEVESQLPAKDSRLLVKFLHIIEFNPDEQESN